MFQKHWGNDVIVDNMGRKAIFYIERSGARACPLCSVGIESSILCEKQSRIVCDTIDRAIARRRAQYRKEAVCR